MSQTPQQSQPSACPGCQAPLGRGQVICVACGLDVRTGQRLTTRAEAPAEANHLRVPVRLDRGKQDVREAQQVFWAAHKRKIIIGAVALAVVLIGVGINAHLNASRRRYEQAKAEHLPRVQAAIDAFYLVSGAQRRTGVSAPTPRYIDDYMYTGMPEELTFEAMGRTRITGPDGSQESAVVSIDGTVRLADGEINFTCHSRKGIRERDYTVRAVEQDPPHGQTWRVVVWVGDDMRAYRVRMARAVRGSSVTTSVKITELQLDE